ncbi:MAG: UDP-N-acetylglucosamine 2-epimerase, partial [Fidelibacterota bacterium]
TEWVETVEAGWNILAGANKQAILRSIADTQVHSSPPEQFFGDGRAAEKIIRVLERA